LFRVNAGDDCAGWVAEVEARFGVVVPESLSSELRTVVSAPEPTFDTVLRCIHALREQQRPA
jgi:hypothetical protein